MSPRLKKLSNCKKERKLSLEPTWILSEKSQSHLLSLPEEKKRMIMGFLQAVIDPVAVGLVSGSVPKKVVAQILVGRLLAIRWTLSQDIQDSSSQGFKEVADACGVELHDFQPRKSLNPHAR